MADVDDEQVCKFAPIDRPTFIRIRHPEDRLHWKAYTPLSGTIKGPFGARCGKWLRFEPFLSVRDGMPSFLTRLPKSFLLNRPSIRSTPWQQNKKRETKSQPVVLTRERRLYEPKARSGCKGFPPKRTLSPFLLFHNAALNSRVPPKSQEHMHCIQF